MKTKIPNDPVQEIEINLEGQGKNITHVGLPKGRYALREKVTGEWYKSSDSPVRRTTNVNEAKIFSSEYLINEVMWEWHFKWDAVPVKDVISLAGKTTDSKLTHANKKPSPVAAKKGRKS